MRGHELPVTVVVLKVQSVRDTAALNATERHSRASGIASSIRRMCPRQRRARRAPAKGISPPFDHLAPCKFVRVECRVQGIDQRLVESVHLWPAASDQEMDLRVQAQEQFAISSFIESP